MFKEKWCNPDSAAEKVSEEALHGSEVELGISFPIDYRSEVLETGLPSPTLSLLSAIVDRQAPLYDLSSLFNPSELVDMTRGWIAAGMPNTLIAIGSDSSGNIFCFDRSDLQAPEARAAAIFFWDHDFDEVQKLFSSFSEWIESYVGRWSAGLSYRDF